MIPWALLAALLFPQGDVTVDPVRPAPAYVAPMKTIPLPLHVPVEPVDPTCQDSADILDTWVWGPQQG